MMRRWVCFELRSIVVEGFRVSLCEIRPGGHLEHVKPEGIIFLLLARHDLPAGVHINPETEIRQKGPNPIPCLPRIPQHLCGLHRG